MVGPNGLRPILLPGLMMLDNVHKEFLWDINGWMAAQDLPELPDGMELRRRGASGDLLLPALLVLVAPACSASARMRSMSARVCSWKGGTLRHSLFNVSAALGRSFLQHKAVRPHHQDIDSRSREKSNQRSVSCSFTKDS